MSYKSAGVGRAIASGAFRLSDILMQLQSRNDQNKRYDAETAYRKTQDDEAAKHRAAMLDAENQRNQMTAIESGFKPARPMGELLMGVSAGGPLPSPVLSPEVAQPRVSVGGRDMVYAPPKREPLASLSRGGVTIQGVNAADVPQYLSTLPEDAPPQITPYQQEQLKLDRERLRLAQDTARREGVAAPKGLVDLPAEVQKRYGQVRPAYDAHADYKRLTEQYLKSSPVKRGLEAFIPGDSPLIAELTSAKERVKTTFKAVAELGALSGDDMKLMEGLIGDATDPRQMARDPQGALNRLKQAERFLDSQANTLERNYGVKVDRPAKSMEDIIADYVKTIR